ncbi:MAG: hypothetical protein RQ723_06045 [Desulfuromonadales bacterium]|nr:hypothetical protein [Desulfuromonadales bacterium]
MNPYRFAGLVVLLLLLFAGCTPLFSPERQGRKTVDDFIYTLRWMQFPAAAGFMQPDLQKDFLDQFKAVQNDLTITDVRLAEVTIYEEGRRVETAIEMDYYLLPSAMVKTLEIEQAWDYIENGRVSGDHLITTPFPEFPRD